MTFSDSTISKLADAMSRDIADEINEDDRFITMMMDLIVEVITDKMGQIDEDLLYELSSEVFTRLRLHTVNSTSVLF